jgi:electron transfer flavoprotein alpha subunit
MILVIAEQKDGKLNRASLETIAAAQQLSMPVKIAVAGQNVSAVANELAQYGDVIAIDHAALSHYTPDALVQALQQVVTEAAPAIVMLPHTYQTRDFSPTLATRMDRALITDVIGVKGPSTGSGQGGAPSFARPMFQGKLTADVQPQGPAPHFVTIQIGAFRADAAAKGTAAAAVSSANISIDESRLRQKPEAPFQEAKQAVDLSQAERIVAVGRGIKSEENLAVAEQLATAFGAELAASRPICDNGWLPMERQIGSSGQTVAPKLYVALGISGAIQHLVGMKGSRTIVAINKDADAPIFEVADYGIQGDLFELAPAIIAELQK